jgi:hypothetical protein
MATATKTRGAVEEMERLEREWAEARAEADDLARELTATAAKAQGLGDDRRRLAHNEPGLVLHDDQPNPAIEDNPIVLIDAEIGKIPDLADLKLRVDHAGRLATFAEQRFKQHIAENFAELADAEEQRAREDVEAANAMIAVAAEQVEAVLTRAHRLMQLAGAGRRDNRVPQLDHISSTARDLRQRRIAAPVVSR